MKLYSYEDFKKHPSFNLITGLCENTFEVYKLINSPYDDSLADYLLTTRLRLSFPIGINGYNKRTNNNETVSYGATTMSKARAKLLRARDIYRKNQFNNTMYTGMQDALRHNLYHKYCLWLKANNPDVIYPAPIDFL